jgi:hypothetical protein
MWRESSRWNVTDEITRTVIFPEFYTHDFATISPWFFTQYERRCLQQWDMKREPFRLNYFDRIFEANFCRKGSP